jgi:hypothetical protein
VDFDKIKFVLFNVVKEGQFDVPKLGYLWYTTRISCTFD